MNASPVARIRQLEADARQYKTQMRIHRARLHQCMDELSRLRALAASLGLHFAGDGEGENHGQSQEHQHRG